MRKALLNGSAYFKLKATNEQIIWTSDIYENGAAGGAGEAVIEVLKKYVPDATIDDQTVLEYL